MLLQIITAIFGALLKIYDDIIDIPTLFTNSSFIIELIKGLLISCITYISIYDIYTPLYLFVSHVLVYLFIYKECLNTDFYQSSMIILCILLLISFTPSALTILSSRVFMIFIGGFIMDHYMFPEEHSISKIIARTAYIGFIICMCICMYTYDTMHMELNIIFTILGYMCISVGNMIYAEYKLRNTNLKPHSIISIDATTELKNV